MGYGCESVSDHANHDSPILGSTPDAGGSGARFPSFGGAALAALTAFGDTRTVATGDVLFRPGDESYDFFVVLEGEVEVVRVDDDAEVVLATHHAGGFVGELNLFTGQRVYLTGRVSRPGRVVAIRPAEFRTLMSSKPELADIIFGALVARREAMRFGGAALAVRIIGSRYSPEAMALRAFATRSRLPHAWIDVEEADDIEALLTSMGVGPEETPVVVTPTGVLRRPSPEEFAVHLGLAYHPIPGRVFDLVVVGTGPAGLAAAVYGASEGLDTVCIDAVGVGGQAGASSRIENYVGFPSGISGQDLTAGAALQAQRLGASLASPVAATKLRAEHGFYVVVLSDDREIHCRAVIVATGARYRRLAVADLDRFEGAGVYYAATELEARLVSGFDVIVVGSGNSAGQAAIYLAQRGSRVSIAFRRDDLSASMSRYLIARIGADPRIDLIANTEVRELFGDTHLEQVTLEHTSTRERETVPCAGLFCFIGADPATSWLSGAIALDSDGFILTFRFLDASASPVSRFHGRPPLPFETSVPGIFAVGDVRHGSVKRVAAAVGEGSGAVRSVHDYFASRG